MIPPLPDLASLDLARRLLEYETQGADTSESSAIYLVSEKLRRPLSRLMGTTGFRSLLSRALTLASAQAPALSAVQIHPDGSLGGLEAIGDRWQRAEAGTLLIAQLFALLVLFVGDSLVLSLVSDIWPNSDVSVTGNSESR